jgi:hypothetical protein
MKYLILTALVVVYATVGHVLDEYEVITKPAHWSMYGYFCGAVITALMDRFDV